jgi:hypothetical protein
MTQNPLGAGETQEILAGRYRILAKLGEGGMGTVYLARHVKLDRQVALKMLPPQSVNDEDAVARFQREARALARLSHPGIVQAHDTDEADGRHFLVMEYVEGISLARLLHDKGRLLPTQAADYIHQAALALQHAHEKGLIHRDLKPSNLLLTPSGQVKLLDLGLARFLQDQIGDPNLTREGMGMGTPDYTAPEQFRNAHFADARSDIYGLGCTLYHLITGTVPFPGSSLKEKVHAHEHLEPAPVEGLCPEAPLGLSLVISRMMAKKPADRFQSAGEAATALAAFVAGSSTNSQALKRTASWHQGQLTMTELGVGGGRRRGWRLAAVSLSGALLLALLAGLHFGWFGGAPDDAGPPAGNGQEEHSKELQGKAKDADDPNVLTVSQDPKDGGQFRTIKAALDKVQSGMIIRVLDQATYTESLLLNRAPVQQGITLEAVNGAKLVFAKGNIGLEIQNVPGVTVRGFRLSSDGKLQYLMVVSGRSHGVRVQDLDLQVKAGQGGAVSLEGLDPSSRDQPVVVENCIIRGVAEVGLRVSGTLTYQTPRTCGRVILRNNTVLDCQRGIVLLGCLKEIHVVGNRIAFSAIAGLQLENLMEGTEDILLANNTMAQNTIGFRLWEDVKKEDLGRNIRLVNNLTLGSAAPDMVFFDSGGEPFKLRGPGNGSALLTAWHWSCNWREAHKPKGDDALSQSWIPPGDSDVRKDTIDVVSRVSSQADFLRPAKKSPLADAGAGGNLPSYVGAVPPQGTEPWNWQWTWAAYVNKLLTVSKEPKDGGRFRTIGAALAQVMPGMIIRVLDDATYDEALKVHDRTRHARIRLESPKRAMLTVPASRKMGLAIVGVPQVTVQGFRCRLDQQGFSVGVGGGAAAGVSLEDLDLQTNQHDTVGVTVELLNLGNDERPVTIKNCLIEGYAVGIQIAGKNFQTGKATQCCRVKVCDNRIVSNQRGITLDGLLRDVAIVGNRVCNCSETAFRISDLSAGSKGILIANNSMMNERISFKVADPMVAVEGVTIRDNLILTERGPDLAYTGEDAKVLAGWKIDNNWRQVKEPEPADADWKMWILSPHDKMGQEMKLISLIASEKDFLRPRADSPLATAGAGGDLPAYVGAVPPPGVEPWDWDKTWKARFNKKSKVSDAEK